MFGYIRPYTPDLSDKDYEIYKAVYCGLCKRLGDDYGFPTQAILSYDAAFLALMAMALEKHKCEIIITRKRCTCNPLKKCGFFSEYDSSLKLSAAFSVLAFYYKLCDTEHDEKLVKAKSAQLIKSISVNQKLKAAKIYPDFDAAISEMLNAQFESEKTKMCSVDRAADPTAKMLSSIMMMFADNEEEKKAYCDFGYFLGRWIYLMDAVDDFEKDRKNNSFNPIAFKFSDSSNVSAHDECFKSYCNGLLNQTAARIVLSYKSMNINSFNNILNNIIYKGLADMQRKVIFDRKEHSIIDKVLNTSNR